MGYKRLYIWVEGASDIRFFDSIIKPVLEKKYDYVKIIQYAETKTEYCCKFLDSIKGMAGDYVYARDINRAPCVTAKKQEIQNELRNIDEDRIIVVIKEIESWYLAGLNDESAAELKIHSLKATDDITKEQFDNIMPKPFDSRIDFMSEILKRYSIEIAKQKNRSFRYFAEKHNREVFRDVSNSR